MIVDIPVSADDLRHIGIASPRTLTTAPRDGDAHDRVVEQAARTPDSIAVVLGDESPTYAALDAESNRLARRSRARLRARRSGLPLPAEVAECDRGNAGDAEGRMRVCPGRSRESGSETGEDRRPAEPRVVTRRAGSGVLLEDVRVAGGLDASVRVGALTEDVARDLDFDARAIAACSQEPVASSTEPTTRPTSCSPLARPASRRAS